uniref:Protein SIP5 n=1 Tax=Anthurium amnicola TaxID=1678845 RepID=A0A1D1XUH8_9ARAE
MGNWICGVGRRGSVEERLTRPQRLARQPSNVDYKRLRKLILSHKLAPCFDALEDPCLDLEECPICFFFYPSLNRSRCCSKGICTECFLQMKPSNANCSAHCPFCKTSRYAVEYRGARTKEEKELELAEEQKVIEAKIRMQSQEAQNVEQDVPVNRIYSVSDVESPRSCLEEQSTGDLLVTRDSAVPLMREGIEVDSSLAPNSCNPRSEEFDVDLEEIMVMEAIWQSLQDFGSGDGGVDRSKPCQSPDQCEASSSSSDAHPLPRRDRSWLEVVEPIDDIIPTSSKPCEDSEDSEDSSEESDGSRTNIECMEDCSFTEDDLSWRSAQLVPENHVAEGASAAEGGSLAAEVETESFCPSYHHSVSSSPCDSQTFTNNGGAGGLSQLSALNVGRQMMLVMESSA